MDYGLCNGEKKPQKNPVASGFRLLAAWAGACKGLGKCRLVFDLAFPLTRSDEA